MNIRRLSLRARLALVTLLPLTFAPPSIAGTTTPTPTVYRAGFPEGLPGYTMHGDGTLAIEVPYKRRIFECIERVLNARFVFEAYPTKRVLQMLMDDKLDVAFPMGFTPERAATMLQSQYTWENADYFLSLRPIDPRDKQLRVAARLGSPQHVDYAAEGYGRINPVYTYEELIGMLIDGRADVVIIPQSVYEDQKADWPKETIVTRGRARNTGFYLNAADPRQLSDPLNRAIGRCRTQSK